MTTPTQYRVKRETTLFYTTPKILQVMKYRVATTAAGNRESGHDYNTRETAEQVYNNIRALYRRLGYTIADAGGSDIESGLCELWIKDGMHDRNIEIYAIA